MDYSIAQSFRIVVKVVFLIGFFLIMGINMYSPADMSSDNNQTYLNLIYQLGSLEIFVGNTIQQLEEKKYNNISKEDFDSVRKADLLIKKYIVIINKTSPPVKYKKLHQFYKEIIIMQRNAISKLLIAFNESIELKLRQKNLNNYFLLIPQIERKANFIDKEMKRLSKN